MARAAKETQTDQTEVVDDEATGEVLTSRSAMRATALAVVDRSNITFGQAKDPRFRVKAYVAVPMLEVPPGQSFVAQFVDKVRVLPPIEGQKKKYPGDHFASTIKAMDGEARLFTWNTVFKSEMEKMFPNDEYVGEWFQITRLPMKRGKDYATYSIMHLELDDAA